MGKPKNGTAFLICSHPENGVFSAVKPNGIAFFLMVNITGG